MTMSSAPLSRLAPGHIDLWRCALIVALAAALGALLAHFLSLASSSVVMIRFPFGADYGEGIVWQQMRNIVHGTGYARLGVFPAIVYHYPPVYHVTVAGVARLFGADELATGRAISWLCTLGAASLCGWLAVKTASLRDRSQAVIVIALTALVFTSCEPVIEWAAMMRVDMLAGLLSLAGIALTLTGVRQPRLLAFAAVSFVLAFYTKQTSVAAPAAAFVGLFSVQPRRALMMGALGVALGAAVLLLLSWITDGGFLRHILFYNINRFEPKAIWSLLTPLRDHAIYLVLAGGGGVLLIRRVLAHWPDRKEQPLSVASAITTLCYFALKALMLVMIMKSGASSNYLIELCSAVAILVGVAVAPAIGLLLQLFHRRTGASNQALLSCVILSAIALQACLLPRVILKMENARIASDELRPIVQLIRGSAKPVISDDMVALIRAGREVQWEAAITAELGAQGVYDQAAFAAMIRQHRFGMFITEGEPGDTTFDSRYNPEVVQAILQAYPITRQVGRFTVHSPAI